MGGIELSKINVPPNTL